MTSFYLTAKLKPVRACMYRYNIENHCTVTIILPRCIDETNDSLNVPGSGFLPTPIEALPTIIEQQNLDCSNISCQEGFYCIDRADDAVCNPSCRSWKQYPDSINAVFDSLLLMSVCVGLICGVGVLVLAGLRRKKV